MSARRILWWCNAFAPATGGAEIWAQHLVRHLDAVGHDVRVLALTDFEKERALGGVDGVEQREIALGGMLSDPKAIMAARAAALELIDGFQPDLVVVNAFGHGALTVLSLVRSHLTMPVVLNAHSDWPDVAARSGLPLDQAVRRSDLVLCFTHYIEGWLNARWPDAVLRRIEFAVPPLSDPVRTAPDSPHLLYCGRLSPEKGVLVLIDAMARLVRRIPAARLTIAGSGHQEDEVRGRIESLGLERNIDMIGGVGRERVGELIDQSRIVCVPSFTESFGMIAAEAAWRGRAVVASRVGGLPEVVRDGETGILVEPGNPDALAEALAMLIENAPMTAQLGLSARRAAETQTTWDRHAAAVEDILMSAADRRVQDAHTALG